MKLLLPSLIIVALVVGSVALFLALRPKNKNTFVQTFNVPLQKSVLPHYNLKSPKYPALCCVSGFTPGSQAQVSFNDFMLTFPVDSDGKMYWNSHKQSFPIVCTEYVEARVTELNKDYQPVASPNPLVGEYTAEKPPCHNQIFMKVDLIKGESKTLRVAGGAVGEAPNTKVDWY